MNSSSVVNIRQNKCLPYLSFLCCFLLQETKEEKETMLTVYLIAYLIFKAQNDEEEVLRYVLQLASTTLLRHGPSGQLLEDFWRM